jgi:hypothetical protein
MAERDRVGTGERTGALEKCVARGASGRFNGPPLPARPGRHVVAVRGQRNPERLGERCDEPLVAGRAGAKLMIEMDDAGKAQLACGVELAQNVK